RENPARHRPLTEEPRPIGFRGEPEADGLARPPNDAVALDAVPAQPRDMEDFAREQLLRAAAGRLQDLVDERPSRAPGRADPIGRQDPELRRSAGTIADDFGV